MIQGAHVILYSKDPEADRAFFRDVLQYEWVDAGHGWLIFALPPAELAVHPSEENGAHELFLMCENIHATVAELERRGVETTGGVTEEDWGLWTTIVMPDALVTTTQA